MRYIPGGGVQVPRNAMQGRDNTYRNGRGGCCGSRKAARDVRMLESGLWNDATRRGKEITAQLDVPPFMNPECDKDCLVPPTPFCEFHDKPSAPKKGRPWRLDSEDDPPRVNLKMKRLGAWSEVKNTKTGKGPWNDIQPEAITVT